MSHTMPTHRSEEHLGEDSTPPAADDKQISGLCCFKQRRSGIPKNCFSSDPSTHCLGHNRRNGLLESGSDFDSRVGIKRQISNDAKWSCVLRERPSSYHMERGTSQLRLASSPSERIDRGVGAVHADNYLPQRCNHA